MKFTVEMISKNSGRLGCLTKSEAIQVKTPLVMNYTKAASIPYLAREIFDKITSEQQIIEVVIENSNTMTEAVKAFGKGIASFAGLDTSLSLLTLKDPGVSNPSFHQMNSVSILSQSGRVVIKPEAFMEYVDAFKPDLFHIMSDGDTSESCAQKRLSKAVEWTEHFVDECIEIYKKNPKLAETFLIAPVTGGYSSAYRETSIKTLNARDCQQLIGGYFLDGFHKNGETAMHVDDGNVMKMVGMCLERLPKEKLKMMLGAYSPILTLKLIQLGVDLFDNTYAYLATTRDTALTFNFDVKDTDKDSVYEIDLTDPSFKDDFQPFLKSCSCLACEKHTRAYTHHLYNTKELQGSILLMIHNTHHYLEFFRAIRQSVADDTLPAMIKLIQSQKAQHDARVAAKEQAKAEAKSDDDNGTNVKKVKIANDQ